MTYRLSSARVAGFAYLWTLLLVAFLGIGLAISSEIYSTARKRQQEKELMFVGQQFRRAIGSYYEQQIVSGQHQYPATLDDLLLDHRTPGLRRHLRKVFRDPVTGSEEWGFVRIGGRIAGVYSLSERPPIKVDNFAPDETMFKGRQHLNEWRFTYPSNLLLTQDAAGSMENINASPPTRNDKDAPK